MTWDDLRLLLALTRGGTLTAAARALAVDRTTAGRRLAALEAELGTRLLRRAGAGMAPTGDARALALHAAEMERAALAAERVLAGRDGRVAGRVRVTATEALASRLLAAPLAALAARHPGLEVALSPELRVVSLARGEADLAVRLLRPDEPTSAGRRIGQVAYAPYGGRAVARRARAAAPGLLLYEAPVAGEEVAWLQRRFPGAPVVLRSRSTGALAAAAAAGGGVAVLPCFVGDAEPALVRLAPPDALPPSELWVIVHRDQRRAARVAAVRDAVEAALGAARPALEGR